MSTSTTRVVSPERGKTVHNLNFRRDINLYSRPLFYSYSYSQFFSIFAGWCQRIKSEFKFEYNYLEDEIAQPTIN